MAATKSHDREVIDRAVLKVEGATSAGKYHPALRSRTSEQLEIDRASLMSRTRRPLPLPEGKTLEDVIVGQWPGDETDEEIAIALAEIS